MNACLFVIDVQESFRLRPGWNQALADAYLSQQNALIAGAVRQGLPIVRIFHSQGPEEMSNVFSHVSGGVQPLKELIAFEPSATFIKHRHSALVGSGLDVWLIENRIEKILISGIRTEQCCETTTRHASDLGWTVDFVLDATLTFDMSQPNGTTLSPSDIKARTATVLHQRFARVCNVSEALRDAA